MTTLKIAVVPAKMLKSGKHKIRIAVGHNKETRYLVTRFTIDNLSYLKDGQVIETPNALNVNMKLRNILNSYQEALDRINTQSYTCKQLIEYLSTIKQGTTSFSATSNEFIINMENEGRKSTAELYRRTCNYFNEFIEYDIMLDAITPRTIKDFDIYMHKVRGLNPVTRGTHMAHIKAIINQAVRDKKVAYETHPFEYYEKPEGSVRELDITIEEVKMIRDSTPKEKSLRVARDLFMLSYYLGGINLIDLMQFNFKNKDTIEYIREKSKNTKKGDKKVSLTIPDEAKPIIKEWIGKNGKLNFGYKYTYDNFRKYVTREIGRLAEKIGIESHVVYYSARKSFVQHGFELGITLETLEYCIGQSMKKNRPIFNYVKIMRKHADIAIRKIIDNLK
ncbi:tyrosine-type recombinase/integrase [Bacteroides nordii]|jgi:integrase|uniref:tyrosine-type recombinase/integrase n=1 Tax=Bacteroides nordii TaxID=291645 RepID=UPI001F45DDC2|nr:site-specific integrase [Bacteroides nordii]MCE8465899.1 site-specific integrase [Bacteroides nordii]UYU49809.1 site-specific integrase [Bacteroides nordii]DAZ20156.1 MAG TPA: Integrase [Caudoviricetes sp.]